MPGAVQKFPPRIAVLHPWAFCSSPPPRPKPCPALRGHCMRHDLPSSGQWDFLLCSRICCSLKQGGPITAGQGPQHPLAVQRGSTLCSWFEFSRCHPCSHLKQIHPAAQLLPSDGDGIFRADRGPRWCVCVHTALHALHGANCFPREEQPPALPPTPPLRRAAVYMLYKLLPVFKSLKAHVADNTFLAMQQAHPLIPSPQNGFILHLQP